MSGYQTVLRFRRLEEAADKLGFMITAPKHGFGYGDDVDRVGLKPKDSDAVPIYARDAEVFCGTLEELAVWIMGAQWARSYDTMLKVSDDKKRSRKEQDVRNKQLVQLLKSEKVEQKSNT